MLLSVVIPAHNEESFLPLTLKGLGLAAAGCSCEVEIVVVDNASTDRTVDVAREAAAMVVREPVRNIARVRNAGAARARGDVLVFVDADTLVPPHFLRRVEEVMRDPRCWGGAPDVLHAPRSPLLKLYFAAWRIFGKALGMAQGAAQFSSRAAFDKLGGYDESLYMGEDVDFFWRLKRSGPARFLADVRVTPSPRRFDRWPLWRTLVWTNPLFAFFFRRRPRAWKDWYLL